MLRIDCPPTHRGSTITFVGEAPGQDEAWQKEGFVGKSGQLLSKICAIGGLNFASVNLSNVVKEHPKDNNFGVYYEDKQRLHPTQALLAWYEALRQELEEHRPNVVVAVGNEAVKALVGNKPGGMGKILGSMYESTLVPGLKVVAFPHPAGILHSHAWQDIYVCGRIVQKVVVPEAQGAKFALPYYLYEVGRDINTVRRFVQEVINTGARWVIDIETRGGGIACVGIGAAFESTPGDEMAMVVPIETSTGPYFSLEDEQAFWACLQTLSDGNPYLVLQNAPFDLEFLMDYGFVPASVLMDTMTAHHLMYAELPKSLEFLNFFYPTGIPYYKDEGKTWGKRDPDAALWQYCAKDLVSELRVSFSEEEELRRAGMWEYYQENVLPALPLALEMQRRGFVVNDPERKAVKGLVLREWKAAHDELTALVGHDVKTRSTKDVPALLYQQLGFPRLFGKSNADEDALVALKSWLAAQRSKKHTKHCEMGKKKCAHKTQAQLDTMARVLSCLQKERKLLKAESSYLADVLYDQS